MSWLPRLKWLILPLVLFGLACGCTVDVTEVEQDRITQMDFQLQVGSDSDIEVTQTITVRYATPRHGPYVWYVSRAPHDFFQDRVYTYRIESVVSPTGAPAAILPEQRHDALVVRIGSEYRTVTGTQTYVLKYTIEGALNSDTSAGMDELWWNIIGTGWEIPIDAVSVSVTGPAEITAVACHAGAAYSGECGAASASGDTATFSQGSLQPGQGMSVTVGWPSGTFADTRQRLELRGWVDTVIGIAVCLAAATLTFLGARALGRKRDAQDLRFADVELGVIPADPVNHRTIRREVTRGPERDTPPERARPGELALLLDETQRQKAIAATLIDLGQRGLLTFNWQDDDTFTITCPPPKQMAELRGYEARLLFALSFMQGKVQFAKGGNVALGKVLAELRVDLENALVNEGFTTRDKSARGAGGVLLGFAAFFGLIAWLPVVLSQDLPIWLIALPMLLVLFGMTYHHYVRQYGQVRTPIGSAVAAQGFGFKQFMETAESKNLRWLDGDDIFARYLPYAIAFGLEEQWMALAVEGFAALGVTPPSPDWWVGQHDFATGFAAFDTAVTALSDISTSYGSSSSSDSGFSGGGDSGGGGGGGGGGTW
ncbi:MAG: DUF2207 domain-containing protein [Propionibacteriaceae bacterium]|nr:DUF2207 domain-containing protein [Propionibacteriaceae bacterium]